jgi:hypothetical protein
LKLAEALFIEMNVESPINPLGSIPGPGYASPGFKFNSAVGSQDSEKQAYINFGKKQPSPHDKMLKAGMCPECGKKLMPGSKFCKECRASKVKRGVKDEVGTLGVNIDAPGNGFGSMY